MTESATVTQRGAQRWARGHPWIFKSDVRKRPSAPAGTVRVRDDRGRWLGVALWSPSSEISLRLLDPDPDATIDPRWWRQRLEQAIGLRRDLVTVANAYRLVHAEGDGLPALICDRYDRWLVVQLLSAAVESFREPIVEALVQVTGAEGVLARNDVPLRTREGLARETVLLYGDVPREVIVTEHGVRYAAAPWTGQKTGAFLDQRENRVLMGSLATGKALDCFSYHGSFALHLARQAQSVIALDSSADALVRARENATLNSLANVECIEANAFDYLREKDREGERFDTIVLDPPAFAKNRDSLDAALRGYHEINLRAMRLLAPGGMLYTASCSFHMTRPLFLEMVEHAAQDSGRRLLLRQVLGQPIDHPEVVTIPETGYLKGVVLQAAY
ncbi:partial Ribosomal RNA large subunit methyltransferase I, partial [uncultured bacterium]